MDDPAVFAAVLEGMGGTMVERLSDNEAIDLGERLDRLARDLTTNQEHFLKAIMVLAEVSQRQAAHCYDEALLRSFAETVTTLRQAYTSPQHPISVNPLPIPHRRSDDRALKPR